MHAIYQSLGIAAVLVAASTSAMAHGGGLDANGCHNNRKTGDYHCHRAPAVASNTTTGAAFAAVPPAQATSKAPTPAIPTCHVGPRGGTYTITASGRKNYGGC
jgi:hypothetical protein